MLFCAQQCGKMCPRTDTPDSASFRWQVSLRGGNSTVVPFKELDFILSEENWLEAPIPLVGSRHQPLAGFKRSSWLFEGGRRSRGSNGSSWPEEAGVGVGQVSTTQLQEYHQKGIKAAKGGRCQRFPVDGLQEARWGWAFWREEWIDTYQHQQDSRGPSAPCSSLILWFS